MNFFPRTPSFDHTSSPLRNSRKEPCPIMRLSVKAAPPVSLTDSSTDSEDERDEAHSVRRAGDRYLRSSPPSLPTPRSPPHEERPNPQNSVQNTTRNLLRDGTTSQCISGPPSSRTSWHEWLCARRECAKSVFSSVKALVGEVKRKRRAERPEIL
jgi:hypothetical protein